MKSLSVLAHSFDFGRNIDTKVALKCAGPADHQQLWQLQMSCVGGATAGLRPRLELGGKSSSPIHWPSRRVKHSGTQKGSLYPDHHLEMRLVSRSQRAARPLLAVLSKVRSVAEAALELEAIDKGESMSGGCSGGESTSGGRSGDEDTSAGWRV